MLSVNTTARVSVNAMRSAAAQIVSMPGSRHQALMPLAGYLLSSRFEAAVMSVGHWIAFAMLSVIGGNMVTPRGYEKRQKP